VLLITGKASANVLGAREQLGSRARSTFIDMEEVSTVDAVSCHRSDCLTGEHPLLGHLM
jgi:hypothetical protein